MIRDPYGRGDADLDGLLLEAMPVGVYVFRGGRTYREWADTR
jgi:hypothetical protein